MKVTESTLKQWKLLRQHTDVAVLHNATGISRYKISLAINYGAGDEETISAITKYFDKRKRRQIQLSNEATTH